jgi:hypothetical protein
VSTSRAASLALLALITASAIGAQTPATATVVDTEGKRYVVAGLEAKYTPGGNWIGGRPTTLAASLHLQITAVEGRITTHEQHEFKFALIRRIVFDRPKGAAESVRIELRDGSQVILTRTTFEKADAKGAKTVLPIDGYSFVTGGDHSIDGFKGRAKTASGKEGEFWIDTSQTSSIEFQ